MPFHVAVVGPGGVGAYFGGMFARSGAQVTMIGRPGPPSAHLTAMQNAGLRMATVSFDETVQVATTTDSAVVAGADLVLFCVKAHATEEAAAQIAPHLGDAIVIDMQNGVDNPDKMQAAGIHPIPAVVYVAAAIESPGVVTHRGRGDLVIGHLGRSERDRATSDPATLTKDLEAVAQAETWLREAGIGCVVTDDIVAELWLKLTANAMGNAISAITDKTYGGIAGYGPSWEIALDVAREAVEVGLAAGVALDLNAAIEHGRKTFQSVAAATSSTQQDIAHSRPTEVDALNGYLARLGQELGVPTPVNRTLWALVRLREL